MLSPTGFACRSTKPTTAPTTAGGVWIDLTANLSGYAGQTVTLGFRYKTDPAVSLSGFSVDDIVITSSPTDGAETDPGWMSGPSAFTADWLRRPLTSSLVDYHEGSPQRTSIRNRDGILVAVGEAASLVCRSGE